MIHWRLLGDLFLLCSKTVLTQSIAVSEVRNKYLQEMLGEGKQQLSHLLVINNQEFHHNKSNDTIFQSNVFPT